MLYTPSLLSTFFILYAIKKNFLPLKKWRTSHNRKKDYMSHEFGGEKRDSAMTSDIMIKKMWNLSLFFH